MATTYDSLPLNVSSLFEELVSTVAENLEYDINFKKETWNELCRRMAVDNTDKPLIALIENFDEEVKTNDPFIHVNGITLVIAKKSNQTWLSEKRIEQNFIPWLYPMYSELMDVISHSPYLAGPFRPHPVHKYVKSYNVGESEQNKTGMKLPESWDAIIITDLNIRVIRQVTAKFRYGATARVLYKNIVNDISINCNEANRLTVTINGAEFEDLHGLHGGVVYTVYFEHDGTTTGTTVGGSVAKDLSGVYPRLYFGLVKGSDEIYESQIAFYYAIDGNGNVYKYLTRHKFRITHIDTSLLTGNNYLLAMNAELEANINSIKRVNLIHDGMNNELDTVFEVPVNDTGWLECTFVEPGVEYGRIMELLEIDKAGNDSLILPGAAVCYYKIGP